MPDVGLTTFNEPLSKDMKVVIKYSVEVEGLPVYTETYDVDKIADEVKQNPALVQKTWWARIECVLKARNKPSFSANLTGCLSKSLGTSRSK